MFLVCGVVKVNSEASMGLIAGTGLVTSKDRKLTREGGREERCL